MRKPLRILFLTSAHNSLSQRLWIELGALGHEICVCVIATDEAMIAAVSREVPDLIIAPMLKIEAHADDDTNIAPPEQGLRPSCAVG